jgi:folate-binding protein YgfZ
MKKSCRSIIRIFGPDASTFLQGLMTQDIYLLNERNAIHGAFLNPQGRFLFDVFMVNDPMHSGEGNGYLLDVDRGEDFLKFIKIYKLRSLVSIESLDLHVQTSMDSPLSKDGIIISYQDPRHELLGYRSIVTTNDILPMDENYTLRRVTLGIPDGHIDMEVGKSIILEWGYDDFKSINWKKGCYTGQELMSRTHHLGTLRKRVLPISIPMEIHDGIDIVSTYEDLNMALAMVRLESLNQYPSIIIPDWVQINHSNVN